MSEFPLLFSPLTINRLQLANRIVMPAMHLGYTPQGKVTDQLVAFYAQRAQGGAGLIIVGGCVISPLAGGPDFISLKDDSDVEGMGRLARAVHDHGAAIGAQLYHAGAYVHPMQIGGATPMSASEFVSPFTRQPTRAMSLEDIGQVQEQFAAAARRAREAGFDLVEILGSAGYLVCQFLSPKTNQRQDDYGGSLENRMRFGLEVIARVREAVGPEMAVGIRIAGHDFVPGSHTNAEAVRFARACQEAGVDYINVTGGWHETKVPQLSPEVPPAGLSYLAREVRRAVSVPVCASNRINTPDLAEEVLARGDADLVCIGRGLIADPEFPLKARQGGAGLVRRCIACNQGCFDQILVQKPVICAVNPRAGHEEEPPEAPADNPGLVAVVGGGPAGCEAALAAARRGHQVVLFEQDSALGGQPRWYGAPLHKPDFATLARYHARALALAGVEVRLGERAEARMLAELEPRAVILASGAQPLVPEIPGARGEGVVTAWDLLQGKARARGDCLVIGGGAVGLETALFLARRGALTPEQAHFLTLFRAETPEVIDRLVAQGSGRVTVLEMLPKLGQGIGRSTRWIVFGLLKRFGVETHTKAQVQRIEPGVVTALVEGEERRFEADTVVLACGNRPEDALAAQLTELGLRVITVGDAAGAGSLLEAVAQGYRAGCQV